MLRQGLIFLSHSHLAKRLVTGAPVSRSLSRRFVPGETVDAVLEAARRANRAGLKVTCNYLGEAVGSRAEAEAAANVYLEVLDRIAREGIDGNISVKLSQLGQDIDEAFLRRNARRVVERAAGYGIFVRFDMESSAYVQRTLDLFERLWTEEIRNIGVVLQAYLRRTEQDARRMVELGARVRLCKGAYAEPPHLAFQDKRDVDANFTRIAKILLDGGHYPAIATHDERIIEAVRRYARERAIDANAFEFQMLYGVRRDLQRRLVAQGHNVRVYIPFGEAWYPYLMRRLAERPANLLFFVGSLIRESPLGQLFTDRGSGGAGRGPHP